MKKWPQPKWFWKAIGVFCLGELAIYPLLVMLFGFSPKDLIPISLVIGLIVYPLFFVSICFLLDRKVRWKADTIFYLAIPLLLNVPFLMILPEFLRNHL